MSKQVVAELKFEDFTGKQLDLIVELDSEVGCYTVTELHLQTDTMDHALEVAHKIAMARMEWDK